MLRHGGAISLRGGMTAGPVVRSGPCRVSQEDEVSACLSAIVRH